MDETTARPAETDLRLAEQRQSPAGLLCLSQVASLGALFSIGKD